jgi:small-conductance mechanosensitive channel
VRGIDGAAVEHVTTLVQWLTAQLDISSEALRSGGAQLLLILLTYGIAAALRRATVARTDALLDRVDPRFRNPRFMQALRPLVVPMLWWLAVSLASGLVGELGYAPGLLRIASSLLVAWIVINATSALVRDPLLSRSIATVVWIVVALDIVGLLAATQAALDSFALSLGSLRISLLSVLKAAALLALSLWAAFAVSRLAQLRISQITGLSPSVQVLIANLLKITLVVLAVLIALNSVGIDLTALAVFSGAVGVGVGFGLQKIVSNLVSGVILLLDRSIKPGDVIEVENTFGWITSLGARYVSVHARDGKEYLIPNEDLITHRVINWSFSSPLVRLDVPFAVAYGSDLRRVRELAVVAAGEPSRILKAPAPACHVTGFGASAVELLLRVWIRDPSNGVTNVKGEVLLALYESLNANGIEIPAPQLEVRVKNSGQPPESHPIPP